jgi:hypothetical protein
MKKDILAIDLILILIFIIVILSKIIYIPYNKYIQVVFFILILIHIIQHWEFFRISSFIKLSKSNS